MSFTREIVEGKIIERLADIFQNRFVISKKLYELENISFGHINRVVYHVIDTDGKDKVIKVADIRCGRKHKQLNIMNNINNELCALEIIRNNTNIPIPKIHKVVIDDDYIFIVMDLIEGVILSDVFDSLSTESINTIKKQLQDYIKQMRGISDDSGLVMTHGDLGTYNIMVNNDKVTAIIDWEVSKKNNVGKELEIVLTRSWDKQKDFIANILQ